MTHGIPAGAAPSSLSREQLEMLWNEVARNNPYDYMTKLRTGNLVPETEYDRHNIQIREALRRCGAPF